MAGDYTSTVHDVSIVDKVVDMLIFAEGRALSGTHILDAINCRLTHLMCALRLLERQGVVAVSRTGRRGQGIPTLVTMVCPPGYARHAEAARRLNHAPPKRTRHNRTATRQGKAPAAPTASPPPKLGVSALPPVPRPRRSTSDNRKGRLAVRAILDRLSRRWPHHLPLRMLRYMEDGKHVTVTGMAAGLKHARGPIGSNLLLLREAGLISDPIGKRVPQYHLTGPGFAAARYAERYQAAWPGPLCATMVSALRMLSSTGEATALEIGRYHGCTPTTAREAVRKLRVAGHIRVTRGTGGRVGGRANPHHYSLTQQGRAILICV